MLIDMPDRDCKHEFGPPGLGQFPNFVGRQCTKCLIVRVWEYTPTLVGFQEMIEVPIKEPQTTGRLIARSVRRELRRA